METPLQFYNVRDLVLLPELNPRSQLCEETIVRYMESFEALPPVTIQEATGVLIDGFHRVEAATRLGAEMIPVQMLDIPDEELQLYAGLANCSHGRPMSRAERNRFVVRLVEEFDWPGEKVARTVGISSSSVSLAVREHRYNKELSERLGEEVQVINSSHVQALYRVGDEQRAKLLDAIAGKTDADGRPSPLTGAELKLLVDRLEDPAATAEELRGLLEDPLVRPEPPVRRGKVKAGAGAEFDEPREVERRGPLYEAPSGEDQRAELLQRALASENEIDAIINGGGSRRREPWEEDVDRPLREERDAPAPLGLGAGGDWSGEPERAAPGSVALLERPEDERGAVDALREAERLLCDLCKSLEDGELWEQARAARDLVREAIELTRD